MNIIILDTFADYTEEQLDIMSDYEDSPETYPAQDINCFGCLANNEACSTCRKQSQYTN